MLTCKICKYSNEDNYFKIVIAENIFKNILGNEILTRHECPKCGVIFGIQKYFDITFDELGLEYKKLFDTGYRDIDCSGLEFRTFVNLNPCPDLTYLNWGCGTSLKLINLLTDMGYKIYGYDPFAPVESDPRIFNSLDQMKRMKFDGIMSSDLLEHLQDPIEELKIMKSFLNPGGKMAHQTWCYQYLHSGSPYHLFFFLKKSADIMAKAAGLQVKNAEGPDYIKIFY